MRLAKLGIVSALLISFATAEAATATPAAATSPQVYLSGQWGLVELPFKGCFQRSKAALKSQKFDVFFAKVYPFPGGTPQSVAVGKLGPADHPHTQASVKCVAGGPKGQSFFAVDVATTVAGTAADLATKITDVLFGTSKAAGTRGPGRVISRY